MMRLMSIGTRIFLLLGVIVCFVAGTVLAFLHNAGKIEAMGVEQVQVQMLDLQKQKIQVATRSMALSLGQELAGVAGDEARVEFIRRAVDPIRFEDDKSGYYFVYRGTVNVALPPKKEVQGKDMAESKDKNGVFFVRELARQAAAGGGFVQYIFPKPGKGDQPKLGYAEMIPGTDLWIGTGIYIDNIEQAKQGIAQAVGELVRADTLMLLLVLGAVFLLGVLPLSIVTIRGIVRPLSQATNAACGIAGGSYDVNLDESGRDEVASLQKALNTMARTLRGNIAQITAKSAEAEEKARVAERALADAEQARGQAESARREGILLAAGRLETIVEKVTGAAEAIAARSRDIRQGTDVQRDRIQSTATAMEEMNATVLEVARNASEAAESGNHARAEAEKGAEVVGQSVEALRATYSEADHLQENMNQLGGQAESIGRILGVITDIADQTNLLALNAAIEAARAGDAGRGFAVVADEVRKLAEKTMTATKEVGDAILGIQSAATANIGTTRKVLADLSRAVELSSHSGEALRAIVNGVQTSADQIRGIATAAEEQSAASEEINRSVEEVNSITSATARNVEDAARAVEALDEQMARLRDLIRELKEG
ncbi:methyl-accepting chemotaxis protein [Desulfovibrio aminophilus]|nr:methyl-accepting chemotaxis protein [Desulfovibrio aminophilus]MCM0754694.1 methyl-accepting chemotaxis protein [Desulfovibrio aminophilus]